MFHHCTACSLCAAILVAAACSATERRNPFGLADVDMPIDDDLRQQAMDVALPGAKDDPNAKPWPTMVSNGNPMMLDGTWAGRWNNRGDATWYPTDAKIRKVGDRLFIHCFAKDGGTGWLIEAVRQRDGKYVGRYAVAGQGATSGVWIGRIVNHERIDGDWISGRWDFRRVFEEKRK